VYFAKTKLIQSKQGQHGLRTLAQHVVATVFLSNAVVALDIFKEKNILGSVGWQFDCQRRQQGLLS